MEFVIFGVITFTFLFTLSNAFIYRDMFMSDKSGYGPESLKYLFCLLFFGTLVFLIYASFNGFAERVASFCLSLMLAVTPIWWKYIFPKIPTGEAIWLAIAFVIVELLSHVIGHHFPPAFWLSHIFLDVVAGGVAAKRWGKYTS